MIFTAGPIAERSMLDHGRGDPGWNPTSARWGTKNAPYCLRILMTDDHGILG